jgi:hypothetical protein
VGAEVVNNLGRREIAGSNEPCNLARGHVPQFVCVRWRGGRGGDERHLSPVSRAKRSELGKFEPYTALCQIAGTALTSSARRVWLLHSRESRFDPCQYWGLPVLRKDTPCLGQMLGGESTLFLGPVKQT